MDSRWCKKCEDNFLSKSDIGSIEKNDMCSNCYNQKPIITVEKHKQISSLGGTKKWSRIPREKRSEIMKKVSDSRFNKKIILEELEIIVKEMLEIKQKNKNAQVFYDIGNNTINLIFPRND